MSITESRDTDTKPNTNRNRGKIPKPNRLGNIREMPTFSKVTVSFTVAMIHNTNKIPNVLASKRQIPTWYRFGIGMPKSWYLIDISNMDNPPQEETELETLSSDPNDRHLP